VPGGGVAMYTDGSWTFRISTTSCRPS
jgi:hypothetical protein